MLKRALWPLLLLTGLVIAGLPWFYAAYPLAGTIADAETGLPIAGAAVHAAGHETLTDALGAFRVQGLRARPAVEAEAPGYQRLARTPVSARDILLHRPLTFRLAPVVLEGTVVDDATREPIAGATVQVGAQQFQADAQGHFVFKRLLPGSQIRARATHYCDSRPLAYQGQPRQEIALSLLPATVAVRSLCGGQPIAGATVTAGGESLSTDARGMVTLAHLGPQTPVQVASAGYDGAQGVTSPGGTLRLELRPRALCGLVQDAGGHPLAGALVLARAPGQEPRLTYTDAAGAYRLEDVPAEATLTVRLAGYRRVDRPAGSEACTTIRLEPFVAKGIYLAFHTLTADYQALLRADLDLVDRTELNAVVIEVKTGGGFLGFHPRLPLARELGTDAFDVIDLKQLLADCHQRGIYTIARMPVFADNILGTFRPQWAVHRPNGTVWRDALGGAWLDPYRKEAWEYNVAIAKEAVELGFDEIQFDYVRFPSDGDVGQCRFAGENTQVARVAAISAFLDYARHELDKLGAFFSADLFGLTTFDSSDEGIGQLLDRVAPYVDYVSPMLYPSTYLRGMMGIQDPWRSPYEVVYMSLWEAHKKAPARLRPWLQYFDDYHGLGITYGLPELRAQQQAAFDGHSDGWLFWNIEGIYDAQAFGPP